VKKINIGMSTKTNLPEKNPRSKKTMAVFLSILSFVWLVVAFWVTRIPAFIVTEKKTMPVEIPLDVNGSSCKVEVPAIQVVLESPKTLLVGNDADLLLQIEPEQSWGTDCQVDHAGIDWQKIELFLEARIELPEVNLFPASQMKIPFSSAERTTVHWQVEAGLPQEKIEGSFWLTVLIQDQAAKNQKALERWSLLNLPLEMHSSSIMGLDARTFRHGWLGAGALLLLIWAIFLARSWTCRTKSSQA
jgi:hypothetical protein